MSHPIAIEGVSKRFRLQQDRAGLLKEFFTRRGRDRTDEVFWALRDVTFDIPAGSMYALIGHNGSGKSTLLRCIAGIYQTDGGRVRVDGRISTLLELGAGFHPDLSGRENIYLNATILGMNRREIDRRFDEIVAFAGVERFIDSPVKVYSTGMYVRLGFSVAVHVQPEILIIDEVIAVGDEEFQRKCFDHLYGLRKQGVTIVVVTHGMGTVETMCDGAAWLDHGELQMAGPAVEVAAAYLKRVNDAEAQGRAIALSERSRLRSEGIAVPDEDDLGVADEVLITGVEVRDEDGENVEAVTHGTQVSIAIRYRSLATLDNLTFGYAIHSENGIHVSGSNTRDVPDLDTGEIAPGDGEAVFTIDELPLLPGTYEITAVISDEHVQHDYDRADKVARMVVRRSERITGVGFVEIPGHWRVGALAEGAR